ncbi:F-box protein At1g47340-like [Salvia hispanica]|uniref:F-box protein At1g47340-like n=1 Tax=Salvia hispanica TaxID=49212 RepID=UPI0020094928|nr:F-box protein At1g47340-like [Salvia hispanica]XP_047939467.1 F-box protein At1g47340-like [Salvia hispanica]
MNQELPSEIVADILLRLPLENVAACKCVCKPWLNAAETDDFVESHFSKSAPAAPVLVVSMPGTHSNWFSVFKLEDEHKRDPIIKFDFPQASTIQGSANGLLLLENPFIDHLYVCNPITREYVELHGLHTHPRGDCYGFGVGKISGQHKVVYLNPKSGCHVYTLGTGSSWRRVEAVPSFNHCDKSVGAFVNGNLHWLVSNGQERAYICCFDVETECFSTFSAPGTITTGELYVLGDCLSFCDIEPYEDDNVIWLLKEYEQAEKRWSEVHFILQEEACYGYGVYNHNHFQPINIYPNGDMLILCDEKLFTYYCSKERTVREIGLFGKKDDDCLYINSILLTPNFLSLKRNLGMENVISF